MAKRRSKRRFPDAKIKEEFEQRLLDLRRVTRVTKGGKQLRFRACIVVGNRKGQVGIGLAKGPDVSAAIEKAVRQAKKHLITVPIVNDTIPCWVKEKFGAAKILLRPAIRGKGIIAGSIVRVILELAGLQNITAKILGSNNKINNAQATINALKSLKKITVVD